MLVRSIKAIVQHFVKIRPITVHGVCKVFQITSSLVRVVFALWICFCIGFCLWESAKTLTAYLQYNVKTTSIVGEWGPEGIAFPAITICPATVGLRSVVGIAQPMREAVIIGATGITDMTEIEKMEKMCVQPTSDAQLAQYMAAYANGNGSVFGAGVRTYENTQMDSYHSVVNCLWNKQDLSCTRLFINKPTDSGMCFTFNTAVELLQAYKLEKPGDDYAITNGKTYGSSVLESRPFVSKFNGPNTGISITLRSNASEYCASVMGIEGFIATVHDPTIEPLTWRQNGIYLSVGWHTNVAVSIIKKDRRKTESHGYCNSQLDLFTFRNVVDYKSRDLYAVNCIILKIVNKCKCTPYYTPRGNVFYFSDFPQLIFPYGNDTQNWLYTCGSDLTNPIPAVSCQKEVEQNEMRSDRPCYLDAPKPCEEIKFSTKITASRWPNPAYLAQLQRRMGNTSGMSLEEFQQNFLSVQFYYESPQYTLVTETIKMTWVDLMNQVGGAMGMTLGLSLVGIVEILIWLIMRPAAALPKLSQSFKPQEFLSVPSYNP